MSLAAAVSDLHVEYVDGVTEVDKEARPPDSENVKDANLGAWRAHMNALRRYVVQAGLDRQEAFHVDTKADRLRALY